MIEIISGIILYLVDIFISLIISISIIERLYVSKKFNKTEHFHFYNDLFSWEKFFILISISNTLQIISSIFLTDTIIANFLLKISILIIYNNFWSKIIHSEKLMNIITYERHYFAGIIPFIIVIILFIIITEVSVLLFIFILTSLIPFLIIIIFFRNTGIGLKKALKVSVGAIIIGMSLVLNPILLKNLAGYLIIPDIIISLMYVIAPLSLIIGTMLIFSTFWKDLY